MHARNGANLLHGMQIVDLPGAAGSVTLHQDVALQFMRSDDSVVLLVIGPTKRLDSATVLALAKVDGFIHRRLLDRIGA